jgi:Beta-lactamase enzyme family
MALVGAACGSSSPSSGVTTSPAPARSTTSVPHPTSTSSAAAPSDSAATQSPFAGLVSSYVATRSGSVEAALYDLRTGHTWELNPGLPPQQTASIVKVDILETLLYQARVAHESLSPAEQELMTEMIEISSNDAATALWYMAGGKAGVTGYNSLVGLTHTVMANCTGCQPPSWGTTTTTPEDQLLLLRQLALPSRLLTVADQKYALSLMSNIASYLKWGVSESVPPGSAVAMKTGDVPITSWSDEQVNSIGWVDGGGHDYLLAMLTTADPSLQYGVDTLNEMSTLMWRQWGLHAAG